METNSADKPQSGASNRLMELVPFLERNDTILISEKDN